MSPVDDALRVSTVRDAAGVDRLAGAGWDDLVRGMERPSPFLLHGWLSAWCRQFGSAVDLQIHVAHRGDRLVGALPLHARRTLGVRVADFVGGSDAALGDVLLAPGEDGVAARALAERAASQDIDCADLHGLPATSRLAAALGPDRLLMVPRAAAPVLDVRDGWQAVYRARVAPKHRQNERRKRRRLGDAGRLEVRVARGWPELAPALEDAFAVHALRWNGRPDGSDFATPAGRAFQRSAFEALAAADVPRIVLLTLDGRPIAFVSFFLLAETMVVHRLAFDPAYARWSAGLLAAHDALEVGTEEGARRVEFLGGAEPYKRELTDRFEPLHEGVGLARGVRGRAAVAARRAVIGARRELARRPRARRAWYEGLAPARRLARRAAWRGAQR
ncbi:MAG: hypothetical protein QOG35_725 [Solirubrobacteraceae bacterium]|nr:hypothetical protein [Solirubrobacteraceae bacterium]